MNILQSRRFFLLSKINILKLECNEKHNGRRSHVYLVDEYLAGVQVLLAVESEHFGPLVNLSYLPHHLPAQAGGKGCAGGALAAAAPAAAACYRETRR